MSWEISQTESKLGSWAPTAKEGAQTQRGLWGWWEACSLAALSAQTDESWDC